MRILNSTNWSSRDIERIIVACCDAIKLAPSRVGDVIVKNGRTNVWLLNGRYQIRLGTRVTATPLQAVSLGRLLSNEEFTLLLRGILKSMAAGGGVQMFDVSRVLVSLGDGLPEWARELPLAKTRVGTPEWAADRAEALQEDSARIAREIQDITAAYEQRLERLNAKQRSLNRLLGRTASLTQRTAGEESRETAS